MSDSQDAWSGIPTGASSGTRIERRADASHPLDFFRARDARGHYLLILKADELPAIERPPTLAGLVIRAEKFAERPDELLIELVDAEQLSIFRALAADILEATRNLGAGANAEGALRTISRIERWQDLLRKRRDQLLSRQAIIGLVGELLFLRNRVMENVGPAEAIASWRGPLREEQDFAIGGWIVEIKTQLSTADQLLKISSEAQLDTSSGPIVLVHQTLAAATRSESGAVTLNGLVAEIRTGLLESAPASIDIFEAGMIAAGYEARAEYEAEAWLLVRSRPFEVADAFPRLVPAALPAGVQKVSYSILPSACSAFERNEEWLKSEVFHEH